jgi:hypothetical protein
MISEFGVYGPAHYLIYSNKGTRWNREILRSFIFETQLKN